MLLLASSVCGLFKWRQFEPEMILLAVGWYLRFHCRTVTSRNSLLSVDFWSTTSPSGGGSNVRPHKFSVDCDRGSDRLTTVGGWMRPTFGLRGCLKSPADSNFTESAIGFTPAVRKLE